MSQNQILDFVAEFTSYKISPQQLAHAYIQTPVQCRSDPEIGNKSASLTRYLSCLASPSASHVRAPSLLPSSAVVHRPFWLSKAEAK